MPAINELLQEGRYRIDQRSNGSENAFEAYDTVRHVNVVVQEIPVKLNKVMTVSQQESLKVAFSTQAKALTEVSHDSLPPVHDFFSEIDRQFLVIEAVDGQDLAGVLNANKRPFAVADITRWADELLDALSYLHGRRPSIIHRNIRPHNLKLSNGRVKLLGVSLEGDPESGPSDDLRYSPMEQIWPGLDAASQKVITNSYDDRSERILKEPLDARSDIYSLGATLYFLATGCEPVDPLERSIDILEGKLDPLREPTSVNPQIAPEISDVLMKALEIKRENRYDSAMIMRQVLQSAIARVQEREGDSVVGQPVAEVARPVVEVRPPAPAPAAPPKFEEPRVAEPPRVVEQVHAPEPEPAPVVREEVVESKPAGLQNLLDLPAQPEVVAYRQNEEVDEAELAAVLKELEEVESTDAVVHEEEPVLDLVVENEPAPVAPVAAAPATSYAVDDDEEIFSVPAKSGSSLPIPAIAGAVGLVVVLAVGGWFMMSGSPAKPEPAPAQVVQEPAPSEPAPSTDTIATTTQPNDAAANVAVTSENTGDQSAGLKPTPKPKKTEPAKTPEKKKVTVDDLINDN